MSAPVREILVLGILALGAGCSLMPVQDAAGVRPPPPECAGGAFAFAGRGTLRGVGLVGHSAATLPEPDRPAMIWVTADLLPFDHGAPGGGDVEMTRMLCFEFDDGSGGSEWPVDAAWQAPGSAGTSAGDVPRLSLVLVATVALAVLVASAVAFRRR